MGITVKKIYVDDLVKQYIAQLVDATRHTQDVYLGVSPRGSLALFRTAQAYALIQGRDYVLPDDIKYVAGPVLGHRIVTAAGPNRPGNSHAFVEALLETVPVPGTRVK